MIHDVYKHGPMAETYMYMCIVTHTVNLHVLESAYEEMEGMYMYIHVHVCTCTCMYMYMYVHVLCFIKCIFVTIIYLTW